MAVTKINIVQIEIINKQLYVQIKKLENYENKISKQLDRARATGCENVSMRLTKALSQTEISIRKMNAIYRWVENACEIYRSANNNTKDDIVITEKNKSAFDMTHDVLRLVKQVDNIADRNRKFFDHAINNIYEYWSEIYTPTIRKYSGELIFSVAKTFVVWSAASVSPVFAIKAILAYEDLHGAVTNWVYAVAGEEDKIGSEEHVFRDLLVDKSGDLGEMLGDRTTGEVAGEFIYIGMNTVDFLGDVDDLLKSVENATDIDPFEFGEQQINRSNIDGQFKSYADYVLNGGAIGGDSKVVEKLLSYEFPDLYHTHKILKNTYSVVKGLFEIANNYAEGVN